MPTLDQTEPTIFVIYGGTGDLTWRKLMPALYNLSLDGRLPEKFSILIVGRSAWSDAKLRLHLRKGVDQFSRRGAAKDETWRVFANHISYHQGDYKQSSAYTALAKRCAALEKDWGAPAHRIFYLATPPSLFGVIPKFLGKAGLARDRDHARLVIEKPLGYDLASAQELNTELAQHFDEKQIFRIDHYLGKETVQNILAFRFANPLFEPLWNRRYIDYLTITVAESVGVEDRGGYYDGAGALRDMIQSHLLQLFCLVAMEPVVSFEPDEVRNKKVDVLHATRPIDPNAVQASAVRGQYGPGAIRGKPVVGYREEPEIRPDSQTDTFAAVKLLVDNWRWQGVPFYLRTGKRMSRQVSEIAIQFRAAPHQPFAYDASSNWQPSRLVIAIQPDEGIVLTFQAKQPGPKMQLKPVDMRFNYRENFSEPSPDAYEALIWDVMKNDQTLSMRADQVEAAWKLVQPILDAWAKNAPDFPNYPAGSWGPDTTQRLLDPGHRWSEPIELVRAAPAPAVLSAAKNLTSKKPADTKSSAQPKKAKRPRTSA